LKVEREREREREMCDCGGGGSQAQAEIKTTGLPPKVVIIGRAAVGKTR